MGSLCQQAHGYAGEARTGDVSWEPRLSFQCIAASAILIGFLGRRAHNLLGSGYVCTYVCMYVCKYVYIYVEDCFETVVSLLL